MLVTRKLENGELGKKIERLYERSFLYEQREEWANYTNKHLAKAGLDIKIDHRSNKERGIDLEPQNKIGPNDGRVRYSEKVLEHEDIARGNGEKIYNDPSIAIKALSHYKSTFTHEDIARFVNTHTVDVEQFEKVYQKIKNSEELIKLGKDDRDRDRYTTKEMLDIEYRMVRQSQSLSDAANHQIDLEYRERVIKDKGLSESQGEAFRHITGDRDMACVVGYAGSGKSYMLGAARKVWEKEGYNVVGMTLSGIAAENLEGDSGIKSYTVANRMVNWNNDRERLQKNDIVVVDEAGMLGSRDLSKIIDEVTLADAKVVLIGDPQQLQAIEAGGAFRGVIERVGHVELNDIRRQKESWQIDATKSLALGEIGDAIGEYGERKMVHAFKDVAKAREVMVNNWHKAVSENKSAIMLSFTRADVKALNEKAREVRRAELGIEAKFDTHNGKRDFAIEDRIYFLKNDKELGVKNGTLGTIDGFDGWKFEVNLDKGGKVVFDVRDYNHIDHGYAATIHKSQGITVDKAFVMPSKYMDKHSTYVAMSRHRESVELYWSKDRFRDQKDMVWNLSKEGRKELALDYLEKDYKDTASTFAINKGISNFDWGYIREKFVDDAYNRMDAIKLNNMGKSSILSEFGESIKKEFQYSLMQDSAKDMEVAEYIGDIEIEGQKICLLEKNGIKGYMMKNVNTEDVKMGDEIMVVRDVINDKEEIRLVKEKNISFEDRVERRNDTRKKELKIKNIGRNLSSKENYKIDNNISTNDIYKALYGRLQNVLPEFGFERKGNCYVSSTGNKVDGSTGHKGKVYVYANNPGILVDYTRGSKSIWDYVSENYDISNKKDVFEYLASSAGIKSYFSEKLDILNEGREKMKDNANKMKYLDGELVDNDKVEPKQAISSEIWDKVYSYSLEKINIKNNQVMKYLTEERGYKEEAVKAMGIGYMPNKRELIEHLGKEGVSSEKTQEIVKALGCIGYSHKMVMPFYGKKSEMLGLVGRDIKYNEDSKFGKYIYSKGLVKSSTILGIENIGKSKEITIVEGMLDAMNAKVSGIKNVVALGGTGINIKQLELIDKLGIEKINLCLDNDSAGKEASKNIALQLFDRNDELEINKVSLPKGIKDLDQLIREKGRDMANNVIEKAKEVNVYELQEEREMKTLSKFQKERDGYEYELEYKKR
jgi:Ti-type conjugative transfer relaxase TraA